MKLFTKFLLCTLIISTEQKFLKSESTDNDLSFKYNFPAHSGFPRNLFENFASTTMPLKKIETVILAHITQRQINNWFFTNIQIHNATLQALHAYRSLRPDQQKDETIQNEFQKILDSHALFLYHPFYWQTRKHVQLVDSFIYTRTGKRYEISRLDRIQDNVHLSGTTPIINHKTSTHLKKSNQ